MTKEPRARASQVTPGLPMPASSLQDEDPANGPTTDVARPDSSPDRKLSSSLRVSCWLLRVHRDPRAISQRPVSIRLSARRSLTSCEVRARDASQDRTPHAQFDGVSSACVPARARAGALAAARGRASVLLGFGRLGFNSTLEPDLLRWTTFRRSPWVWGPPIPRGAAQVLRRRWSARCSVTLSTRSLSSRDTLALASYSLSTILHAAARFARRFVVSPQGSPAQEHHRNARCGHLSQKQHLRA